MGVSVLQIYPAQPDKTGPQIIDTLTRRIMNLGKGTSPRESPQLILKWVFDKKKYFSLFCCIKSSVAEPSPLFGGFVSLFTTNKKL